MSAIAFTDVFTRFLLRISTVSRFALYLDGYATDVLPQG